MPQMGPRILESERPVQRPRLDRRPEQDERAEILDRWRSRGQSVQTIATLLNIRYGTVARIVGEPL